jgi:hypothetical protein
LNTTKKITRSKGRRSGNEEEQECNAELYEVKNTAAAAAINNNDNNNNRH